MLSVLFFFLRLRMIQTAMIMAARTAIPPTTPPTMGPIGVEPFFLLLVKSPPLLVSPKPGPGLAMDVTSSVTVLVADVKVTEAALVVVDLTPAVVVASASGVVM